MKKNIAFILVFALLLTVGTISPFDSGSNGTKAVRAAEESDEFYNEGGDQAGSSEEMPYQIGTAAQLRHLYDLVKTGAKNKNDVPYSECYYKLIQDITVIDGTVSISMDADGTFAVFLDSEGKSLTEKELSENKWDPISGFNGHFDGDGKTISGLYMIEDMFGNGKGLFSQLGEAAVIQNLSIKNTVIVKTNWFIPIENDHFIQGYSEKGSVIDCQTDGESCHIGRLELEREVPVTATPVATTPAVTTPAATTPAATTPAATTPVATTPAATTPAATTPAATTPAVTTPAATTPAATTSPATTPAATTSAVTTPAATTPSVTAPAEDTPSPVPTADTVIPKGEKVKVGGVTYEGVGKNEVAYSGTANIKKGAVTVPASVKVNGVSCKVTTIGEGAFAGNKKIKKVILGNNVKTIGKGAFKNCTTLTSVTFPAKIKTVSDEAFYNCRKLKQAKLPITVKTIGKATFKNCVSMKKFSVGAKTSKKTLYAANTTASAKKISIGASAMENCIKLKQIVINAQVRRIGNAAFRQCKNLADIFVYSLKLQYVGKRALKGVSNCKISVPKKKVSPYTKLFRNKGQGRKVVVAKLA